MKRLLICVQFYVAIQPLDVELFFKSYLAFPIVLLFWLCGWLWKREGWRKLADVDVDTGRREVDWERIRANEERIAAFPAWRRILYLLF